MSKNTKDKLNSNRKGFSITDSTKPIEDVNNYIEEQDSDVVPSWKWKSADKTFKDQQKAIKKAAKNTMNYKKTKREKEMSEEYIEEVSEQALIDMKKMAEKQAKKRARIDREVKKDKRKYD